MFNCVCAAWQQRKTQISTLLTLCWDISTSDSFILFTKGQQYIKRFHIIASSVHTGQKVHCSKQFSPKWWFFYAVYTGSFSWFLHMFWSSCVEHSTWALFNPHPVMSPDLHGLPAGPRRPGTMNFKCVEFLVQLKNKNSWYWLSHITTALNCKIWLIFSKYLLSCEEHDREKYERKCNKNIYFSDKWK